MSIKRDYVLKTIIGIKIPNLIDKFVEEKKSFHMYDELTNNSLYNFFLKRGYCREEIRKALNLISDEDLVFLKYYYGKNLESKLSKDVTIKEKEKLLNDILDGSLKRALKLVRNRVLSQINNVVNLENVPNNNFKIPGRNNKKVKKIIKISIYDYYKKRLYSRRNR